MSEIFERAKDRLLEKIETPSDLLEFKLGSALKMEHTVLEMLDKLQAETHNDRLRQQFSHHAGETRGHIAAVERSLELLGAERHEKPCPTIEALDKEGKALIRMSDERVRDAVILSGAAETEHHEIAVYEGLITQAEAQGKNEIAGLLRQNLEQEQHTLEEVKRAMSETAHVLSASG